LQNVINLVASWEDIYEGMVKIL